jgi:SAM-dependent methyltransferase
MKDATKWNMYIGTMQGHGGLCKTHYTVESMSFITGLIPTCTHRRVLDIGVAEGLETSILKKLGYDPTGIIVGSENKQWAKDNYPDIEFIECDMHDLPFKSGTFDAVYMNQVFEHAFAPFILMLEIYCVLRDGGLCFIEVPRFDERHTKNNPDTMDAPWVSHHHPSVMPSNVMIQIFEKTGFEISYKSEEGYRFLLKKMPLSAIHGDVRAAVIRRGNQF